MAKQKKEQKTTLKSRASGNLWLKGKRLYALIIFAFSFALYFNTLFNDYNLDDELVTQNHIVTSKGWSVLKFNFDAFNSLELKDSSLSQKLKYCLPVVFRVPYYQDYSGFKYEYRPMVFASFALEHALFSRKTEVNGKEVESDSPAISHFINIVLYSFLCTVLFLILCRLFTGYNLIFSFLICMLFAAFPMHTEVVASIKNRDEMLALLFALLSLFFSMLYVEKNKPSYLVLILLFYTAGVLSKPTIITFALLIPLCLVLFTNCSYRKLMLLAVILIIPTVFYSRLYSVVQQLTLAVVIMGGITGFFAFKNPSPARAVIKNFLLNIYSFFRSTESSKKGSEQKVDFSNIKPGYAIFLVLFGVIMPCGIAAFGISTHNPLLACLPFLFSCVLYLLINNELKLIFITPLALLTLFAMIKFSDHSNLIETCLILFLISQIFSDLKAFRIAGIINYLILGAVSLIGPHTYHFLFMALFIGLLNRKLWPVTITLLIASALVFIRYAFASFHGTRGFSSLIFLFPLFYLFLFLLLKGKWRSAIWTSTIFLPLSLAIYFMWQNPQRDNSAYFTVKRAYYQINEIKAPDPSPVQSVRPLNFPEYPLTGKDPFSLKFGTAMQVMGKYLGMVLIPYPMSYYYGYSYIKPESISEFFPMVSMILHLLLLGIAFYFFRRNTIIAFSILFYLISVGVFSNLVKPVPGMIADRFILIPSIGFCVFVVYLLFKVFKQNFEDKDLSLGSLRLLLKISLAALLVVYSGLSFSRNFQWKDQVTLFRHDITVVENSAQAQNLLGVHLFLLSNHETDRAIQKQLREEAVPHFKKALEIYPDFLNASYDLARAYDALRLSDLAYAQYQATLKIDTHFYAPYFNMATILHNNKDYAGAIPLYQKFLTQYPKQLEAYTNMSFAYFQLKDFENSIATNRKAMIATGNAFYPTVNIAKTYAVMGQNDSALFYFEQAHVMQPNDGGVNLNIEKLKGKNP